MYNRYIPQPDGTYRRNRIQETNPPQVRPVPMQPPAPIQDKEPEAPPCSSCTYHAPPRRPTPQKEYRKKDNTSIRNFLQQLLPKDFDIEDLLVVILLLLMAGDCRENQNSALLTLVLYLFL